MSPFFVIKSRKFNPVLLYHVFILYLKNIFRINFTYRDTIETPIDVLIPTVSKDYDLLEEVVESLKFIKQPINKIYIISQANEHIINFCAEHNIVFVNERKVLGYDKTAIEYMVNGTDRSGWIFQQLLKLSGDKISEEENFLILDSDTLFIKDISFIKRDGKFCLQQSYEWHQKYFDTYKKLLGQKPVNHFSCVAHMMIFNKKTLKELKKEIEDNTGKRWDKAILDLIDNNDMSYFSEYETYGNFIRQKFKDKTHLKVFYNHALSRKYLHKIDIHKYSKKYNSLSFHEYIK